MTGTLTTTITKRTVSGDVVMVFGTITGTGGNVTGDILTGLRRVLHCNVQPTGDAVDANQINVNETMPCDTGNVTVVRDADAPGTFVAFGTE